MYSIYIYKYKRIHFSREAINISKYEYEPILSREYEYICIHNDHDYDYIFRIYIYE